MTDVKQCVGCGSTENLNFCIFFIPIPVAAKIREKLQEPVFISSDPVASEFPEPPKNVEQMEMALLCHKCSELAQIERASFDQLPPLPSSISFMSPLKFITPQLLNELYNSHILVHTPPADAYRMCFGINITHATYINACGTIYRRTKREFEDVYRDYVNQETIANENARRVLKAKSQAASPPSIRKYIPLKMQPLPASRNSIVTNPVIKTHLDHPSEEFIQTTQKSQQSFSNQEARRATEYEARGAPQPSECYADSRIEQSKMHQEVPSDSRFLSTAQASYRDPYRRRPSTAQPSSSARLSHYGERAEAAPPVRDDDKLREMDPSFAVLKRQHFPSSSSSSSESSALSSSAGRFQQQPQPYPSTIVNPLFLDAVADRDMFVGPFPNSNWVIPSVLLIGGHPTISDAMEGVGRVRCGEREEEGSDGADGERGEYDKAGYEEDGVSSFVGGRERQRSKGDRSSGAKKAVGKKQSAAERDAERHKEKERNEAFESEKEKSCSLYALLKAGINMFVIISTDDEEKQIRKSPALALATSYPARLRTSMAGASTSTGAQDSSGESYFFRAVMMVREDTMRVLKVQMEKERAVQWEAMKREEEMQKEKERIAKEEEEKRQERKRKMRGNYGQDTAADVAALRRKKYAEAAAKAAKEKEDAEPLFPPSESIVIPEREFTQSLDTLVEARLKWKEGTADVDEKQLMQLVDYIVDSIVTKGYRVFVQSTNGHGRAGVVAALVLARLFGTTSTSALAAVHSFHSCRSARYVDYSCPANHAQRLLVHSIVGRWSAGDGPVKRSLGSEEQRSDAAAVGWGVKGIRDFEKEEEAQERGRGRRKESRYSSELPEELQERTGLNVLKAMMAAQAAQINSGKSSNITTSSSSSSSSRKSFIRPSTANVSSSSRQFRH
ncbi:uncharacterized protein MONOS_6317 [Monocercomonoides exilis]|uniref:uncharacterized protein n=1 Tax=Monocercomonoides exilis TaxID=2049356 RepID=UPI00355A4311|nr:hypothetical protein MONOS_6317 [Monocercomonoides exilis]|eukprot:MONOS_6317.1-p1 / transcript=MONOS_6317.1 / gene=MONOS_6317 / organism=Monocercomonoides_exilis_PA203 / gene_product=unspecified product / transcript_product=unspecified product / location=Mono_scaffold00197:53567-56593(-) / protein_length=900 / sequence_SO=supercontig / SO=protein_coding / is_pseudo=false